MTATPTRARPGRGATAPRRRQDAELLLAREDLLAVGVPAVVELAGVPVGPLLGHVVRRVGRAEAQVQVEGLVGVDLPEVGDELDRLVDQVLGQVVALLGRPRRLDRVVVVDEVRVPLARVAAEEAVEALEAAPERPAVVRAGRRLLVARRQVPLADHVRAVAVLDQHLRQHAVLERHDPVVARVAGGELGDAGHAVAVVVPPGDDARAARRAQRRRVHVAEAQAVRRERVEGRASRSGCRSSRAVRSRCRRARRTGRSGRPSRARVGGRPGRARLLGGPADHAREGGAGRVLDDRHGRSPFEPSANASVGEDRRDCAGPFPTCTQP